MGGGALAGSWELSAGAFFGGVRGVGGGGCHWLGPGSCLLVPFLGGWGGGEGGWGWLPSAGSWDLSACVWGFLGVGGGVGAVAIDWVLGFVWCLFFLFFSWGGGGGAVGRHWLGPVYWCLLKICWFNYFLSLAGT